MKSSVILLLGSNLGDRQINLEKAVHEIEKTIGPITTRSSFYESEAWGKTDQPWFLNQVVIASTLLSPLEVLNNALAIEKKLGRTRSEKWGARLLDIDILYFDTRVITSQSLIVPHPRIAARRFVLEPLVEILPTFIHPVSKKNHLKLLAECEDTLKVIRQ